MHWTEEKELVKKCVQGNKLAQKQLYNLYCDAMYTIAYRIVGNFDDAKDVLQDAFIKVFKNMTSFRFESTLGAWIKVIVIRTAYRNAKKLVPNYELDVVEAELAVEPHSYDFEHLETAIAELPVNARTVFTLIEIEGYKHNEVSELLGVTEGTSKSQLHYAKKLLKKKLSVQGK